LLRDKKARTLFDLLIELEETVFKKKHPPVFFEHHLQQVFDEKAVTFGL
jgi:hypothetical protein